MHVKEPVLCVPGWFHIRSVKWELANNLPPVASFTMTKTSLLIMSWQVSILYAYLLIVPETGCLWGSIIVVLNWILLLIHNLNESRLQMQLCQVVLWQKLKYSLNDRRHKQTFIAPFLWWWDRGQRLSHERRHLIILYGELLQWNNTWELLVQEFQRISRNPAIRLVR